MLSPKKDEDDSFSYDLFSEKNNSISLFDEKDNISIEGGTEKNNHKKIFTSFHIKKNIFMKKEINTKKQKGGILKGKKEKFYDLKATKNSKDYNKSTFNINNKVLINKFQSNKVANVLYRKDAYYKYFKVKLGKFIKNKINILKNICFRYYSRNNFSTPNYKYIGNPKEKENFLFLSFTIKDILIYGKDKIKYNR